MKIDADKIGQLIKDNHGVINQYVYLQDVKPLPSTIPSNIGFVGREAYLRELKDSYDGGNKVFVLHGLGGIGKTALAHKFAEEIAPDFDAHIYLNLQLGNKTVISPIDAMLQVLHSFNQNVPADTPYTQIESLFISLLNQHKILLLLDNAKERIQIEPLNRTKKTCLLITSRESFVLTGGKSIQVKQMSLNDAKSLLFSITPEERFEGQAEELAKLAGYLPMALLPLAALLAENEMETAMNLVRKYQDSKHRLELADPNRANLTVFASFELSYEVLSEKLQECWRRLAVFPSDFDKTSAQAALNTQNNDLTEILKQLYKYNLIDWDKESDRLHLHDLARDFLLSKSKETESIETHTRVANFYKSVHQPLEKCNSLEDFSSRFGEMFHCSQAGLFYRAIFAIGKEAGRKLRLMGYSRRIIAERLKLIGKSNDLMSEAFNYGSLAVAFKSLGELQKALEIYEESLSIYRQLNAVDNIAIILMNMSNISLELGRLNNDTSLVRKGLTSYQEVLPLSRQMGDRLNEANILANMGNAHLLLEEYSEARKVYSQALQIQKEIGDEIGEYFSQLNIAISFYEEGQLETALDIFNNRFPHIEFNAGHKSTKSKILAYKGFILYAQGKHKEGCVQVKEALKITLEIEDKLTEVIWRRKMAEMGCDFK